MSFVNEAFFGEDYSLLNEDFCTFTGKKQWRDYLPEKSINLDESNGKMKSNWSSEVQAKSRNLQQFSLNRTQDIGNKVQSHSKGHWTKDEDEKLKLWMDTYGEANWTQCADFIIGRTGKQCRERWMNVLNPNLNKGFWSVEEDYKLCFIVKELGTKWTLISKFFNNRALNDLKNRFYFLSKKYNNNIQCSIKNNSHFEKLEEQYCRQMKLSRTDILSYKSALKNEIIIKLRNTRVIKDKIQISNLNVDNSQNKLFSELNDNTLKKFINSFDLWSNQENYDFTECSENYLVAHKEKM
jgi:hypothetical protein